MTLCAKDVMVTTFDKIDAEASLDQAIKMILDGKTRASGHKTVSLMVLDDFQRLTGVITMFDILYHLRPSFLNFGVDGDEFPWDGQTNKYIKELKTKKVNQVMTRIVTGALPEEHLMIVLDRMVKKKYRRLPVLENGKPVGIVYISDIYHRLFSNSL